MSVEPDIRKVHRDLVDRLSRSPRARSVPGLVSQWSLWWLLSALTVALFLGWMGPQPMSPVLRRMPSAIFLVLILLGAGLAAWEAIGSSLPGRKRGPGRMAFSLGVLAALFALPFLFLDWAPGPFDPMGSCRAGMVCCGGCALAGLVPWIFLGRLLSKNASFKPLWTGAWAGASAFLVGTFTIQVHCPNWEGGHVLSSHLLPMAFGTLLAAWAGSHWFSLWRRKRP